MFTGITRRELQTLPAGIALLLNDAIYSCRSDPPSDWPESAYRLIVRQDLAAHCCHPKQPAGPGSRSGDSLHTRLPQPPYQYSSFNDTSRKTAVAAATRMTECEQDDGMEAINQEVSIILYGLNSNELWAFMPGIEFVSVSDFNYIKFYLQCLYWFR